MPSVSHGETVTVTVVLPSHRDSADLRIAKGIRKPSFSTHVTASQMSAALHLGHGHGHGNGPEDGEPHLQTV